MLGLQGEATVLELRSRACAHPELEEVAVGDSLLFSLTTGQSDVVIDNQVVDQLRWGSRCGRTRLGKRTCRSARWVEYQNVVDNDVLEEALHVGSPAPGALMIGESVVLHLERADPEAHLRALEANGPLVLLHALQDALEVAGVMLSPSSLADEVDFALITVFNRGDLVASHRQQTMNDLVVGRASIPSSN